jgi:hypothetical protein
MKKEEFECIGVDVSKNTLDVALFRGKVDWNEGHIKVENNCVGYKEMKKWLDGFRRYHNPDTKEILADKDKLEQLMRECIQKHNGYITAGMFARYSGLTLYSARKQLNEWTRGENPKLLLTARGKEHIYTET